VVHAPFRRSSVKIVWSLRPNRAEFEMVGAARDRDLLNAFTVAKPRDRGSKMRLRGIPEFEDERVSFERLLHDAALHAATAAVNEPDLAQTAVPRGRDVLFDNGWDVARSESVEVEGVFDRNPTRHGAV
jgi:hypothetical protein